MMRTTLCCLLVGLSGCGRATVTTVVVPDGGTVEVTAAPAVEDPPFELPNDAGGALLAKALPPAESRGLLPDPRPALPPFPAPHASTDRYPSPVVSAAAAPIVPLKVEAPKRALTPRLLVDEATFATREDVALPQVVIFPTPDRDRVAAVDAHQQVTPPVLAVPQADRAPLDDPTLAASAAAALAAPVPLRLNPVPFLKLAPPDPYENRRAVKFTTLPPEDPTPAASTPRLPR